MNVSIRQRLTLWYAAGLAVLLTIVAMSLLVVHGNVGLASLDAELERANATVASVLQNELEEGLAPKAAAEEALAEVRLARRHVAVLTWQGTVLAQRWNLPFPPSATGDRTWTVQDYPRTRIVARAAPPVPAGFVVITAASWEEIVKARQDVLRALFLVVPPSLLIAALGVWWIAGRALRPAATMAAEAGRITERSSGARLTVDRPDELGRLAIAFNELLERLETALRTRRQFLADASHELRTPVSVARTAAEVALGRAYRTEAEYRDALSIVAGQMKGLGRIVSDMLTMSKSDASDWPLRPTVFYFDELLTDVVGALRLLARERDISIEPASPHDLEFNGDEGLLRQMVTNLIENAVHHTPDGGTVRVEVTIDDGHLALSVCDTGQGIAESNREKIFDRFVHIDTAHDDTPRGMGLGLAIARGVARAHGGDVTLHATSPDGTTFLVVLPFETGHAHANTIASRQQPEAFKIVGS